MPESPGLIQRGLRYERAGVLEEAMECYKAAFVEASGPNESSEALRRQADVMRIRC